MDLNKEIKNKQDWNNKIFQYEKQSRNFQEFNSLMLERIKAKDVAFYAERKHETPTIEEDFIK